MRADRLLPRFFPPHPSVQEAAAEPLHVWAGGKQQQSLSSKGQRPVRGRALSAERPGRRVWVQAVLPALLPAESAWQETHWLLGYRLVVAAQRVYRLSWSCLLNPTGFVSCETRMCDSLGLPLVPGVASRSQVRSQEAGLLPLGLV